MRKIHFLYLGIIIILFAVLVAIVWNASLLGKKKTYSAVYLASGDLYFGELRIFPTLTLHNAHALVRRDEGVEIIKFSNVFWGPKGSLRLNRENILWIAEITEEKWIAIEQAIQNAGR